MIEVPTILFVVLPLAFGAIAFFCGFKAGYGLGTMDEQVRSRHEDHMTPAERLRAGGYD